MAKFLSIAVVILFVALCSAEPPRLIRRFRNRSRFLARQEIESATPYPAAGEKPDVEFDLPEDESAVFGDKNVIGAPDQTYGPPETEAEPVEPQEDFGVEPELQRFTSSRGNSRFVQQRRVTKLAPLRKAAPLRNSVQLQQQAPAQLQQLQQLAPVQLQQVALVQFQQLQQPALAPASASAPAQLQQQLLAQPILLADGRVVYSILA